MKLYLVRHGRTGHNEGGRFQPIDSALSSQGIKQAKQLRARLSVVDFDFAYSSDSVRAIETCSHILPDYDLKKTELLRPMKKPSEVVGLEHEDPEVIRIHKEIDENMENPSWHYSDEENFYDFKNRLVKFLSEVQESPEDSNVLAVTHSLVIRLAVCICLLGNDLTASQFHVLRWRLHATNTGITVMSFEEPGWRN